MGTQANAADAGSVKNAIRWGLLLAAIGTAGFRLPRIVGEFRAWREALGSGDSLASQSWHTALTVDLVGIAVILIIGVGVFYVLRSRAQATR